VILAADADGATNGGLSADSALAGLDLTPADGLVLEAGGDVIDEVTWTAGWPWEAGASLGLHEDYLAASDNEASARWCAATSSYGDGDLGTPGDANDSCYTYTHAVDVQPIWTATCTSCHSGSSASGSLRLSSPAWSRIVDQPSRQLTSMDLVEPGDTSHSYLYLKLTGAHTAAGGSGSTMPASGSLSSADRAIIRTWIEEGAPE
jgi:hypothetical protein